jgi:hypothetical protein
MLFDSEELDLWIASKQQSAPIRAPTISSAKALRQETDDFNSHQNSARFRLLSHEVGKKSTSK